MDVSVLVWMVVQQRDDDVIEESRQVVEKDQQCVT